MKDGMEREANQRDEDPSAQLGDWAQSLAAKAGRAKAALSPWVQRSLEPIDSPAVTAGGSRKRSTPFSEGHTRALLQRVAQRGQGGRIWQPDVGSLEPMTFDRFSSTVAQRYQPIANKHQGEPSRKSTGEETELVLSSAAAADSKPKAEVRRAELPEPVPLAFPATPAEAAPEPRRPAFPPPWVKAPQRAVQRKPGVRPVSRVEEITPGGLTPEPDQMAAGVQRSAEPAPAPAQEPGPPAGPRVEGDQDVRVKPAIPTVAPGQPATPPFEAPPEQVPLRPPRQRRVQEMPAPAPSSPEAASPEPPANVEALDRQEVDAPQSPPLQRYPGELPSAQPAKTPQPEPVPDLDMEPPVPASPLPQSPVADGKPAVTPSKEVPARPTSGPGAPPAAQRQAEEAPPTLPAEPALSEPSPSEPAAPPRVRTESAMAPPVQHRVAREPSLPAPSGTASGEPPAEPQARSLAASQAQRQAAEPPALPRMDVQPPQTRTDVHPEPGPAAPQMQSRGEDASSVPQMQAAGREPQGDWETKPSRSGEATVQREAESVPAATRGEAEPAVVPTGPSATSPAALSVQRRVEEVQPGPASADAAPAEPGSALQSTAPAPPPAQPQRAQAPVTPQTEIAPTEPAGRPAPQRPDQGARQVQRRVEEPPSAPPTETASEAPPAGPEVTSLTVSPTQHRQDQVPASGEPEAAMPESPAPPEKSPVQPAATVDGTPSVQPQREQMPSTPETESTTLERPSRAPREPGPTSPAAQVAPREVRGAPAAPRVEAAAPEPPVQRQAQEASRPSRIDAAVSTPDGDSAAEVLSQAPAPVADRPEDIPATPPTPQVEAEPRAQPAALEAPTRAVPPAHARVQDATAMPGKQAIPPEPPEASGAEGSVPVAGLLQRRAEKAPTTPLRNEPIPPAVPATPESPVEGTKPGRAREEAVAVTPDAADIPLEPPARLGARPLDPSVPRVQRRMEEVPATPDMVAGPPETGESPGPELSSPAAPLEERRDQTAPAAPRSDVEPTASLPRQQATTAMEPVDQQQAEGTRPTPGLESSQPKPGPGPEAASPAVAQLQRRPEGAPLTPQVEAVPPALPAGSEATLPAAEPVQRQTVEVTATPEIAPTIVESTLPSDVQSQGVSRVQRRVEEIRATPGIDAAPSEPADEPGLGVPASPPVHRHAEEPTSAPRPEAAPRELPSVPKVGQRMEPRADEPAFEPRMETSSREPEPAPAAELSLHPQARAGSGEVQRQKAEPAPAPELDTQVLRRALSRAHLPLTASERTHYGGPDHAQAIRTVPEAGSLPGAPGAASHLARFRPVEETAVLPQARVQARIEGQSRSMSSERPGLEPDQPPGGAAPARAVPDLLLRRLPSEPAVKLELATAMGLVPGRSPATGAVPHIQQMQAQGGEAPVRERPAPAGVVQRQPAATLVPAEVSAIGWEVQRAGEEGKKEEEQKVDQPFTGQEEEAEPDLDDLARKVYPIIRRMLAVERERRAPR